MNRRTGIGRLAIRHALLAAVLGVTIGLGFSVLQVGDDDRASVAAERREILQMLAVMREHGLTASVSSIRSATSSPASTRSSELLPEPLGPTSA